MKWLITGGAGFIGTHLARFLQDAGETLIAVDNFHRGNPASEISYLDVRFPASVDEFFAAHSDLDVVVHLAGQVSLVASIAAPRYDFETNALGTFNVLEAMRRFTPRAKLIYASTNKVYGDLSRLRVEESGSRYTLSDHACGLNETLPLELHGGYSCSKGAADQYVRDYRRVYGLKTVALRQSTIYGGRQFATEDQGWVGWFIRMGVEHRPFTTICGNGKQVRDLLHVSDLCECFAAIARLPDASHAWGEAFNIGGGPESSLSLVEIIRDSAHEAYGFPMDYTAGPPRTGDQKVFIADVTKARQFFGWTPRIPMADGLDETVRWSMRQWRETQAA